MFLVLRILGLSYRICLLQFLSLTLSSVRSSLAARKYMHTWWFKIHIKNTFWIHRRNNIYQLPVLVPLMDKDIKHEHRLFSNTRYPRNCNRNVLTTATNASILLVIEDTPEKLSPWPKESIYWINIWWKLQIDNW